MAAALTHAESIKIDDSEKKTDKRGIYSSGYSGGLGGYDNGLNSIYSSSSYLTPGGLPLSRRNAPWAFCLLFFKLVID